MLTLNILPKATKKEIKYSKIFAYFKKLFMIIIAYLLLITVLLFVSIYVLNRNKERLTSTAVNLQSDKKDSENLIEEINAQIKDTSEIQSKYIEWSGFLQELKKLSDDSIAYNDIKINKTSATIELRGVAVSRESLLSLKEKLENSPLFDDIQFPLKNLLEKSNINFEINTKLNLDEIKKQY